MRHIYLVSSPGFLLFGNSHLTYFIKRAFSLFFLAQVLLHLQSVFHTIFTVNVSKGISALKPADCFPCLKHKVQTLNEAREASGICSLTPSMPHMQRSGRIVAALPQRETMTFSFGPHCTSCKPSVSHGEYHCSYLTTRLFSLQALWILSI